MDKYKLKPRFEQALLWPVEGDLNEHSHTPYLPASMSVIRVDSPDRIAETLDESAWWVKCDEQWYPVSGTIMGALFRIIEDDE